MKRWMWAVWLVCGLYAVESAAEEIFTDGFEPILLWSQPATWSSGHVPLAGETPVIEAGKRVLLDIDSAALAGLEIHGELLFDRADLNLTADWIALMGTLRIGTPGQPFAQQAVITLSGDDPDQNIMGMGTRGLLVMGGTLSLHGALPQVRQTRIDGHINDGATAFDVLAAVDDWQTGEQLLLAPTDYYGVSETQLLTVQQASGVHLTASAPVQGFRWGLLQHLTDAGLSLTPDTPVPLPAPEVPTVLDQRAEVAHVSRRIRIQAPDDALWQTQGFGAHLMVMSLQSNVQIDGVEFRRGGQAGRLGRYPVHWHRLSYDGGGAMLGDATGHYLRNSSVLGSANRCITLHATNGVRVQNNVCFDVRGHGIFFEDAVERRNVVEGNWVFRVRFPDPADALKLHEINAQNGFETGASGLWASNPDNTVRNNVLADAQGFGLWMAFPADAAGVSSNVPLLPYRMALGDFNGNVMHSNRLRGAMFDQVEIDEQGQVGSLQYASTTDGQPLSWPFENLQRFTLSDWRLWKNNDGNFWDRVVWPTFERFVSADSAGKYFSGSGAGGEIRHSLLVGHSLNDFTAQPHPWMGPATAMATYHSAFDMHHNVIVNFPSVAGKTSGAFATDDYYIRAVEKGHIRNQDNLLINAHPGYRSDAAVDEDIAFNFAQGFTHYVFASALCDPNGLWGPAGRWSVYDRPFLTHGANCTPIQPLSQQATSCDGEYFGVDQFILNQANMPFDDLMAIEVTRYDESAPNTPVAVWTVDGAQPGWVLGHMRHFAARDGGIYRLDFPDDPDPVDVALTLENMHDPASAFVLGIRFDGSLPAQVFASTHDHVHYITDGHAQAGSWANKHDYTALGSRQAVIDSAGETYWQDSAGGWVWVKVSYADLVQFNSDDDVINGGVSEQALYNGFHLRVWADD